MLGKPQALVKGQEESKQIFHFSPDKSVKSQEIGFTYKLSSQTLITRGQLEKRGKMSKGNKIENKILYLKPEAFSQIYQMGQATSLG